MARVVPQRPGPPYLLIVVIFLFLISTIFAVLLYIEKDKAQKANAELESSLAKYATAQERRGLDSMFRTYDTSRPKKTVVGQFNEQVKELSKAITGTEADYEETSAKITSLQEKIKDTRGLIAQVSGANDLLAQKQKEIDDLKSDVNSFRQELKIASDTSQANLATQSQQSEQYKQQINELERKLQQEHDSYLKQLQQARTDWQKRRDELYKQNALHATKINELEDETRKLKDKIAQLMKSGRGEDGIEGIAPHQVRVDGMILKMLDEAGVCYINIGLKDRVTPGLTFSIYPGGGIPESGEGKGMLVVSKVSENISECRITEFKKEDPINEGDQIANLAYDAMRSYKFVVEGEFDLHNTGKASAIGAEEVKTLITRFGGTVSEEVSIDTDFIVIGKEPTRPPEPAETAPPTVWAAYNEQVKVFDRFANVKELAGNLQIPILNTNRFVAFVGYCPAAEVD